MTEWDTAYGDYSGAKGCHLEVCNMQNFIKQRQDECSIQFNPDFRLIFCYSSSDDEVFVHATITVQRCSKLLKPCLLFSTLDYIYSSGETAGQLSFNLRIFLTLYQSYLWHYHVRGSFLPLPTALSLITQIAVVPLALELERHLCGQCGELIVSLVMIRSSLHTGPTGPPRIPSQLLSTHLESKDSYVRMLFLDFSSAFNTILPNS